MSSSPKFSRDLGRKSGFNENTFLIKKYSGCGCEKCIGRNLTILKEAGKRPAESDCEGWCDYMAVAGNVFCGKFSKANKRLGACLVAVEYIKKKCYKCCENGEFYKNCVEPFARIVDYIRSPCDPEWD